jgi:hypothetical protein
MAKTQRVRLGIGAIVVIATSVPEYKRPHSNKRKGSEHMSKVQTVEQYISKLDDGKLQDVLEELTQNIVPATGAAHAMVRHVNDLIDRGEMQINPTTYRHINLPSLIKFVYKEASKRYLWTLKNLGPQTDKDYGQLSFMKSAT